MADVQAILQNAPIPQAIKATAWDEYQSAQNEDDLVARLNKLPIPKQVKADLWDAKQSEKQAAAPKDQAPARNWMDSAVDFAKGYAGQVNPLPALEALYNQGHPVEGTWNLLKGATQAQIDQFKKAKQAFDDGRYSEAVGHTVAGALPLMGPAAAQAGEKIGEGKVAEGLGASAALLTPFALDAMKVVAKGAPKTSNLNAVDQAAVDFADKNNIPLTTGERTGSQLIKNAEALIQDSPGGSGYATKVRSAQTQGLTTTGEKLAGEVNAQSAGLPGAPVTTEASGNAVKSALDQKIADLHDQANQHYDTLRQIEADPANAKVIIKGDGTTTSVPLGVDMRDVKAAVKPIYDRLKQTMPIAQQQASTGLKALENILDGEDYVPASIADQNLSAIKSIARSDNPNLRNVAQGTAAAAVKKLEGAVQDAVAQGGSAATDALKAGRAATKAKYAVADVADALPLNEPVKVFNKLTATKDANVNLLRDVAQHAPDAMPQIGRAYVQGLLDTATAEGGFQKAGTLLNKWDSLGDATKKVLFPDPALRARLDNFFLLSKRLSENPNPSGTAIVGQLLKFGEGGLVFMHPSTLAPIVIGNAALSRLLFSSKGAQLLTKAMTLPKLSTALATSTASQLLKMIGPSEENLSPQNDKPDLVPAQR